MSEWTEGRRNRVTEWKLNFRINILRNNLREAEIEDIENGSKSYQTSVYYMDIVNEMERMGDFMINVSQDLERSFLNTEA